MTNINDSYLDPYLPMTPTADSADEASVLENNERVAAVAAILRDIPPKDRDIEKLIDPELGCDDCGVLIPVERQRIVLTIAKECNLCVYCQEIAHRAAKAYAPRPVYHIDE